MTSDTRLSASGEGEYKGERFYDKIPFTFSLLSNILVCALSYTRGGGTSRSLERRGKRSKPLIKSLPFPHEVQGKGPGDRLLMKS